MDKQWQAKWIMDPSFHGHSPTNVFYKEGTKMELPPHEPSLLNRHMLVRKVFQFTKSTDPVLIDITADDYYKLYINGRFVGQGPASGYYFHYHYNRYDITDYLQAGENVVAVHVYYQGLINRVWNSGDYRQGMIAQLHSAGETLLATDASWKYQNSQAYVSGGTVGYQTQFLENIDSRLLIANWRELGFDDTEWQCVSESIVDDHKLYLQPTPPVAVYNIQPAQTKQLAPGHYLVDFGHEITGQFTMEAQGNAGDIIEIRCGEELTETEERVRYKMRSNCDYQEFWTLSGQAVDVLEFYDYKAFRYVEVIGSPEISINTATFAATVRHYPLDQTVCTLDTSNKTVKSVWDICKAGVQYGSQEGFLDCPGREKGQYLGDATVTGHSHMYVAGDLRLYKKAIMDFALSTFICPGLMAVAPGSYMQEIADYSMQWPMQIMLYYQQSGDLEFVKEMYPLVEGLYAYFQRYERSDGLLENVVEKWNLVDWPGNLRDGYDFDLSLVVGPGCHNVVNAFYLGMVQSLNEMRDLLHLQYEDSLPSLRKAFNQTFYNEQTQLFVDAQGSSHSSLHANVMPLLFDLAPMEAVDPIVELIREKRLCCGVYFAYFLLKALARVGQTELLFALIDNTDESSWANMVEEGATTCMEAWSKDHKWNTSLCHAWASAPIPVLIEDIIGLKPALPGWKAIRFRPQIPAAMGDFELNISVPSGEIQVRRQDGNVEIKGPAGIPIER